VATSDEENNASGLPQALWAPWRMEYLKGPRAEGCPLCDALAADRLVVHRGEHAFVIMNLYPYSNGHVMVAPVEHISNLEEVADEVAAEMTSLTRRAIVALRRSERPEGFNVGFNLGKAAGAGIDDHIHQHIVPRWVGDTNFMPVMADVRVSPESLDRVHQRLREALPQALNGTT